MKLLYSQSTQQIKAYPRNDESPIIGLDPDYLVLEKIETDPPTYDPEAETISSTYMVDPGTLEYRQAWTATPIVPTPDWDGLYQTLLGSAVYQHLVGLALQHNAVDSALDKVIASISYGDKARSTVAYDAFQSAVSLLLYALGLVNQPLNDEHLDEIRSALDANNFEGIVL